MFDFCQALAGCRDGLSNIDMSKVGAAGSPLVRCCRRRRGEGNA
nr:MAG TPA_asm: hypothetical protein [Caudoviricetes sp.]